MRDKEVCTHTHIYMYLSSVSYIFPVFSLMCISFISRTFYSKNCLEQAGKQLQYRHSMVSVYAAVMCKVVECTEGGEGVCLPIGGDREFQAEGIIKNMAVESMGHLENYKLLNVARM